MFCSLKVPRPKAATDLVEIQVLSTKAKPDLHVEIRHLPDIQDTAPISTPGMAEQSTPDVARLASPSRIPDVHPPQDSSSALTSRH